MKYISRLNPKEKLSIISISRAYSAEDLKDALALFEPIDITIELGKSIGNKFFQFAGDDTLRTEDFQNQLDNSEIRAIWFACGGYGAIRILDKINWDKFIMNPKWLIGYSDITVIHLFVNLHLQIPTLHATMPKSMPINDQLATRLLLDYLQGDYKPIQYKARPNQSDFTLDGIIVGGNLSIVYSMLGTLNIESFEGKILFLEEIDEYLYHIDRMFIALQRAGIFQKIKGIILGGFTDIKDHENPFGFSIDDIVEAHTSAYNLPIIYDFPAGHDSKNYPIVFGVKAQIQCQNGQISLSYPNNQSL
ncbi:MAG: LD-carboxypeptidase [Chitinophagales bacterium]|jgi:muramoyltetrapeptide carboxypeptidase|nr:LD-carboxypeptidase [Chitinophagales bacterium]